MNDTGTIQINKDRPMVEGDTLTIEGVTFRANERFASLPAEHQSDYLRGYFADFPDVEFEVKEVCPICKGQGEYSPLCKACEGQGFLGAAEQVCQHCEGMGCLPVEECPKCKETE